MRKFTFVFTLILLVLLAGTIVFAEDDALPGDDGPSLCTDGVWDCPDPVDPAREEWNWACGWYWGHFLAGKISEVPDWCVTEDLNLCAIPVYPIFYTAMQQLDWEIYNADTQDYITTVTEDPGLPLCGFGMNNIHLSIK